jgi:hypothetical protein
MPPGQRWFADYLRMPLAIWTDPQAVNPDLLRSVWGAPTSRSGSTDIVYSCREI